MLSNETKVEESSEDFSEDLELETTRRLEAMEAKLDKIDIKPGDILYTPNLGAFGHLMLVIGRLGIHSRLVTGDLGVSITPVVPIAHCVNTGCSNVNLPLNIDTKFEVFRYSGPHADEMRQAAADLAFHIGEENMPYTCLGAAASAFGSCKGAYPNSIKKDKNIMHSVIHGQKDSKALSKTLKQGFGAMMCSEFVFRVWRMVLSFNGHLDCMNVEPAYCWPSNVKSLPRKCWKRSSFHGIIDEPDIPLRSA